MIKKVGRLDINWDKLNLYLDSIEPVGRHLLERIEPDLLVPGVTDFYNSGNDFHYTYQDDVINSYVPDSFWTEHGAVKENSVIKVLEHPPGTFSIPHIDYYQSIGKSRATRFWIPCTDHKFGHAFFVEDVSIVDYRAGDIYHEWEQSVHSGVNAGLEVRRVLTITANLI